MMMDEGMALMQEEEEPPKKLTLDELAVEEEGCLCCCCICHCSVKETKDLACCGCFPIKRGVVTIGILTIALFAAIFVEVFYCLLNEQFAWWYVSRCRRAPCAILHWSLLLHLLLRRGYRFIQIQAIRFLPVRYYFLMPRWYLEHLLPPLVLQVRRCFHWIPRSRLLQADQEIFHRLVPVPCRRYLIPLGLLPLRLQNLL